MASDSVPLILSHSWFLSRWVIYRACFAAIKKKNAQEQCLYSVFPLLILLSIYTRFPRHFGKFNLQNISRSQGIYTGWFSEDENRPIINGINHHHYSFFICITIVIFWGVHRGGGHRGGSAPVWYIIYEIGKLYQKANRIKKVLFCSVQEVVTHLYSKLLYIITILLGHIVQHG